MCIGAEGGDEGGAEAQWGLSRRSGCRMCMGAEGGDEGDARGIGTSVGGVVAGCAWKRKVRMKEVQEALQDHGRRSGAGCAWERKVRMKEVQEALQDLGRKCGCRMCMGAEGGDEGGARGTAGPR
jgi:hypothetical protein